VVKDFDVPVQWALALPKGASAEVVAWYNKTFIEALNNSEIKEFLAKNMFKTNPKLWDPKVFTSYMQQQDQKFQPIVNSINQSIQETK
jgi:tripartite-type tricarboxylate transporter receptor subunit TctC